MIMELNDHNAIILSTLSIKIPGKNHGSLLLTVQLIHRQALETILFISPALMGIYML